MYYHIVAKCSTKCLDIIGSSTENVAKVPPWECHGGDNQLFRIEEIEEKSIDLGRQHFPKDCQEWPIHPRPKLP
jgi:hypothetical protein